MNEFLLTRQLKAAKELEKCGYLKDFLSVWDKVALSKDP